MLQHSRRLEHESGVAVPVVQADAAALPFAANAFDLVATAYGALPFVADARQVLLEVTRVLVPGGRAVLAVTHPIRWAFPDDPGPGGLTAGRSYFDRRPYAETDDSGHVTYVEHHRTVGDWVDLVVAAGLRLDRLVEPPWNPANPAVWGGWSPLRGALLPGTLIIVAHKPTESPLSVPQGATPARRMSP
jgi:SAM-dependent methyltransferase